VTGEACPERDLIWLDHLRPALVDRIRQDHPTLAAEARISRAAADRYHMLYVEELLRQERGELSRLDREVARSLAEGAMVSTDVEENFDEARTVGERLSDAIALFGGSWTFLIVFGLGLAAWIAVNGLQAGNAFDP
jgi:hypothetical protein